MLENTIDLFTARMRDIVLKDQRMDAIPLAYLKTLNIPQSLQHFFEQEVQMWIREEEEKFESERFDYDEPQVRMLIDKIFDHLQDNAVFSLTQFNHLLERAIKLELNYVVKPHRTLTQFIFRNSDTVSTMEVYDTLKYFSRFDYYKNALSDYFNSKYLHSISKSQFTDLIDQIDKKAFETDTLETTLKTIKSIMGAIGEAQQKDIVDLSVDVLYDALSDRNLADYAEKAQKAKYENEITTLNLAEIEALLRDGTMPRAEAEVTPATETAFVELEDIEKQAPDINVDEIEVAPATEEVVLQEEEPEDDFDDMDVAEEAFTPSVEKTSPPVEEKPAVKSNVASDLADHVARQIQSDSPLEDLNTMVVGRIRRKIIKKLFRKNEQSFLDFLNMLNKEETWKSASRIIDDVFYENEINPYSKEAIALSDIIYLRFFPKDKYVGEKSDDVKWD
ncbi:MAG TPA: hypothetical protein ENJ10_01060 [Caldithrix abyssi]|uniref:Uncharacterized protein n=1 Tax=Caldithrix abyssi TaxID=187145 RepID=A0A7V1PT56_CALAY|nr:hypothetical protein [Caldithrix abyssi]